MHILSKIILPLLILVQLSGAYGQTFDMETYRAFLEEKSLPEKYKGASEGVRPYLYKVTGQEIGEGQNVILMGTCHLINKDEYPEIVRKVIDRTEVLLGEIDPDSPDEEGMEFEDMTFEQFEVVAEQLGLPREKLDEGWELVVERKKVIKEAAERLHDIHVANQVILSPWARTLPEGYALTFLNKGNYWYYLSGDFCDNYLHLLLPAIRGMEFLEYEAYGDIEFARPFKEQNKVVIPLDPANRNHIINTNELIHKLYPNYQEGVEEFNEKEFLKTIVEVGTTQTFHESLNDGKERAYYFCNAVNEGPTADAPLSEITSYFNPTGPNNRSDFLRNQMWLPKILETIKSGKSMTVLVGINHLYGSVGLINLLLEHGYKIEYIGDEPHSS